MITTHSFIFLTTSPLLIFSLHFFNSAGANCSPSSCGAIRNISYPFRLKGDPSHCCHPKFELTCENNVTFLYLKNSIKYYVKAINYHNSTIRLVDTSINNDDICSFPITSLYPYDVTSPSSWPYTSSSSVEELIVNLISCPNPLNNSSLFTDISHYCASNLSHPRFSYVHVGSIHASEVPHMCRFDLILVMISGRGFTNVKNVSLSQIHQSLLYGFELCFCFRCEFTTTMWGKKSNLVYNVN